MHCFYNGMVIVNLSLSTEYSLWLIIFCILAGAGGAAILYYKEKNRDFNLRTRRLLAWLRGIGIFLIAFLLLSPMIKTVTRRLEKPIVILAVDKSESVVIGEDSSYYRHDFLKSWNNLIAKLSKKYEVRDYSFSDNLKTGSQGAFDGKQTDMGEVFSEIGTRYANRNIAAVVLASDGIINRGADPLYASGNVNFPILTVAMGDTNQHKDLLINRAVYNQIAFLGNDFPVEISVSAYRCSGHNTTLTVSSEKKVLFTQNISIPAGDFNRTIPVRLPAAETGTQRYRISLSPVDGEISRTNNIRDIFIEVLDGRQKILLAAASPHPDVAAIRQGIEANPNYEVVEQSATEDPGNLSQYDLVILHQIPSVTDAGVRLIEKLRESKTPALYILGRQSNLQAFNQLKTGVIIPPSNAAMNEAYPVVNDKFPLFSLPADVVNVIQEMPPLSVPFGKYQLATGAEVLFNQRIGSVSTGMPLILFSQGADTKAGIVTGEGLWRWRIACFLRTGSHKAFDEFIAKTVQYLAVKTDKSRFRVMHKNSFLENEQVVFDAELYDESYELVNTPEARIEIRDSADKRYPFVFSRTSTAYTLNAGSFPPGKYSYEATVTADKSMQKRGKFTVIPINVETLNTVADHNLLYNLASRHDGIMISPRDLDKVGEFLDNREDIKTVAYYEQRYTGLVNLWWALAVIIVLLGAEWFLRKRAGEY